MAARRGAEPRSPRWAPTLAGTVLAAAVLAGCAAPTPVSLGPAPAAPTGSPIAFTPPGPAGEAGITASPVPVAPAPAPAVIPDPIPPTVEAPSPPPPIVYAPPVTVPEAVLPLVEVPADPPAGPSAADLAAAVADAQRVVGGYWAAHWNEFFTGTYTPPGVLGLYDGTAAGSATCGPEPLPPYNAVYCVPQDYLAWDVTLMGLRTQIGDSWPYVVIAHEWGHAIQARLDSSLNSLALELQADCLAGAALYGAVADGALSLDDGAAREIATALTAASDETPWTDSGDHGNAAERIGAFDAGRLGGVRSCLPRPG